MKRGRSQLQSASDEPPPARPGKAQPLGLPDASWTCKNHCDQASLPSVHAWTAWLGLWHRDKGSSLKTFCNSGFC